MENEDELLRELYARFGLAYYESEVLHRNLCNIYALGTFIEPESITRPRMEEKLSYAFSLTLGRVINETKFLFPTEIKEKLDLALNKRNYLAHHFWFDKNYLMFSQKGIVQLQEELLGYVNFFDDLDKLILTFFQPIREKFGISDEIINDISEELLLFGLDEPMISQRPPNKQERIINVWDVETVEGTITQVFESDDGCVWQLCDAGLGWTILNKEESQWKINEIIQPFLPANLNPRPIIVKPWNYEFQLSRGTTLYIKKKKMKVVIFTG
jgi:hypothetical protein